MMIDEHDTSEGLCPSKPFEMFSLTGDLVSRIMQHKVKPHRHEYEELLIITSGNPVHYIDFNEVTTPAPVVVYIALGKIHEFIPDAQTRGWCIRYLNDFIGDSNFHFYSGYLDRIIFSFDAGDCRQKIGILCELILHEYRHHPEHPDVYRHLLSALLAKLEADGRHHIPHEHNVSNPRQIAFRNFLSILEDNYKRTAGVGLYAEKMNTSIRNLNHLCQSILGKSVSEIIETRKIIEARRLLLNTGMTIAEIGYSLGYNEKSYFTRVFRKKTGRTPSDFRDSVLPSVA